MSLEVQEAQTANSLILVWDLHQGMKGKSRVGVTRTVAQYLVIIHKLEVVKLAGGQSVIKVLHHVPGSIAYSYHYDAEWPV